METQKIKNELEKYLKIQVDKGDITPFCAELICKMAIKSIGIETNNFGNGK